jgi:hypothetical protein
VLSVLSASGAHAAQILISEGQSEGAESGKIHRASYLWIKGNISKGDADTFNQMISPKTLSQLERDFKVRFHKTVFVVLESNGGVAMEALNIGTAIRKMDFNI